MNSLAISNLFFFMAYSVCAQLPVDWPKYTPFHSSPYYYYNHEVIPTQSTTDAMVSLMLQELKETKVMLENVKKDMRDEISNLKTELAQMKKLAEEEVLTESLKIESNENIQDDTKAQTDILANQFENFTADKNARATPKTRFCNCLQFQEITDNLSSELAETKYKLEDLTLQFNVSNSPQSIGKIPDSCADLKQLGYHNSGIFSVMKYQQVESIYCDFTKTYSDPGFQKLIGIVDIKTIRVSFYAQRMTDYATAGTTIPFDLIRLNVGNAMSESTGIFVAPTPGIYFFAYSGITLSGNVARVELHKKTTADDWFRIGQAYGASNSFSTYALQSTLELNKGDQIRLFLKEGTIHDSEKHFTNFVGFLLEEKLV